MLLLPSLVIVHLNENLTHYFNKPSWSHILCSSIYCLRLFRSDFPAKAKESHFGGIVSDEEDNMHSKALKTNKTTNKKNLNNEKLLFAVHVKSHTHNPLSPKPCNASCCPQQLLLLAGEIKAAQITCQQLRRFSHPRQQVCWAQAWGERLPRDCSSEAWRTNLTTVSS